jgi:hypothetical protein
MLDTKTEGSGTSVPHKIVLEDLGCERPSGSTGAVDPKDSVVAMAYDEGGLEIMITGDKFTLK